MKLVCESLEELKLNETYESSKELERVSKYLVKNQKIFSKPRIFKELFKNLPLKSFPILKKFLRSEIAIVYHDTKYPMFTWPHYDINDHPGLYLDEKDFPWGVVIINNEEDAVLHELQHAYDYFRSNRKILTDKKVDIYKKMAGNSASSWDETQLKRYARLKPEQSSFFVEVIKNMKEYSEKYPDESWKDFKYSLERFTDVYPGWERITPKDKKILTRKFFQYWQKYLEEQK